MKKYLRTFFLTFFILLLILLVLGIYPFGDKTLIVSDLRDQYMIFINYLKSIFFGSNTFFYTFSGSLGDGFIPLFAYYLNSIFNLFTLPFNGNIMPLIITIIIIIKISLSSVSMNYFLDKKYGDDKKNIIFSLCYGLMSYTIAFYFHIMWLDVIILLPLVILGIENIINKNKSALYIISLTLSILSNYYLGVIVCIFSVLYFIYYLLCNKKKNLKKIIFKYLIGSLLSGLICAVILLPIFYSLFNSKAFIGEVETIPYYFNSIDILSKSLSFSFDSSSIWHGGPNIFVGSFIILGIILYLSNKKIYKRKRIITGLFIVFLLLTCRIHKIDFLFHGLTEPNCFDFRQAFIISFLFIITAYEGYSNYRKLNKRKLLYFAILVFHIIIYFFNYSYYSELRGLLLLASLLLFSLFIYLIDTKKYKYLYALVIIELIFNSGNILLTITSFEKNASDISKYQEYYKNNIEVIDEIKKLDNSFYRLEKDYHHSNSINDSMLFNYYGISHFDSTSNANTEKFLENIGFRRVVSRAFYDHGSTKATDMFLGIKYLLSHDNLSYDLLFNKNDINIYHNQFYSGLGYITDNYLDIEFNDNPFDNLNKIFSNLTKITDNLYEKVNYEINTYNLIKDNDTYYKTREDAFIEYEFKVLTKDNYYLYFNDNLVRDDYKKAVIKINDRVIDNYFDKYSYGMINLGSFNIGDTVTIQINLKNNELTIPEGIIAYEKEDIFNEIYHYLNNNSVNIKMNSSSSLEMDITDTNKTIILSIPYDDNWKIMANEEEINYFKAYNGLIGFNIFNDSHVIMEYVPKGFKLGLIISLISLMGTIYLVYKEGYEKKN